MYNLLEFGGLVSNEIDKIKNQIDIIDVVQEYVDLAKKGRNYWGICPFHNDSNPSMSVSPEKQMYNCFSCGESGGVFQFVQKIEKISFKEALKKLGDKAGVEVKISEIRDNYSENQRSMINAMKDAIDFYKLMIETDEGTKAREYADKRGMDIKIREKFNIGYAPQNALIPFLKKKGHDESILINASLMNQIGKDFLQDRLVFGITDEFNNVIALSGRTLNDESAKYINSAESQIFKKNSVLYNWNNAISSAKREKCIYLVEGFMDVIALDKVGIHNVVAIMGTAFTRENLSKIKDMKVILMLDSDNAGIKATIKTIKLLLENKVKVSVVKNETKKDPDEILNTLGEDNLKEFINDEQTGLEFIYDIHKMKYSTSSSSDIESFVESFKRYLKFATPIEKDIFANKIQNELGVSKEITLNGFAKPKAEFNAFQPNRKAYVPSQKQVKVENSVLVNYNKPSYKLIKSLLRSKAISQYYKTIRDDVHFIDPALMTISNYIIMAWEGKPDNLLKYKKMINENIEPNVSDVDIIKTNDELDQLIKNINTSYKRYVNKQNKVKLLNKGVK